MNEEHSTTSLDFLAESVQRMAEEGATDVGRERRRDPRFSTVEGAQLDWLDPDGVRYSERARIVNVSLRGLAFRTRFPIRRNDRVTFCTERNTLTCVVRHVAEGRAGRWAGVEVLSSVPGGFAGPAS